MFNFLSLYSQHNISHIYLDKQSVKNETKSCTCTVYHSFEIDHIIISHAVNVCNFKSMIVSDELG